MPPKRKSEAVAAPTTAKKVKRGVTPTHSSPQSKTSSKKAGANTPVKTRKAAHLGSKAVKAPDADDQFEWEILDGDKRETLLVGVVAPNRLTLRFRHRTDVSLQVSTHKYDKKDEKDIDWNNREHIAEINKWRNQIFVQSMKFPPKVTHIPWAPFETAYLELFHEKLLKAATGKTDSFVAPHDEVIAKAFNEYFEGRDDIRGKNTKLLDPLGTRPKSSVASYQNRKDTDIRGLRDQLNKLRPKIKKSTGDDAWTTTINDAEIEQYIREKAKKVAAAATADDDDDGGEEGEEGEDKNTSSEQSSPPESLAGKAKSSETSARNRKPVRQQPVRKPTVRKPTVTKLTSTKQIASEPIANKPKADESIAKGPAATVVAPKKPAAKVSSIRKPVTPRKLKSDPRTEAKPGQPKGDPRVFRPPETAEVPDHPDVIASLKAQSYTWSDIPQSDEEAIEVHRDAQDKKPQDNTWVDGAKQDLEDRIERHTTPGFDLEAFNKDVQEQYTLKGSLINVEDWHEKSARRDGAAAVTALLNTADIPPLGYMGAIRDLHEKRLLSEGELLVADARNVAITKKHEAVERARQMKIGKQSAKEELKKQHDVDPQRQREDVHYDSETTDEEDADDMDESVD
jgi:hypothetical protein